MSESNAKFQPHGEIRIVDHGGYGLYVCGDCGRNVNGRGCKKPLAVTFDALLSDPTEQFDPEGMVLTAVLGRDS